MSEETPQLGEIEHFIMDEIDTVPHLEALLLLWNSRPKRWSVDEMAGALYIPPAAARNILRSLTRRRFLESVGEDPESYRYDSVSARRDNLVEAVDSAYRKELVRISRMIHAKGAPGVRQFAEAFRFKKDNE